jgi:hypothetical protein
MPETSLSYATILIATQSHCAAIALRMVPTEPAAVRVRQKNLKFARRGHPPILFDAPLLKRVNSGDYYSVRHGIIRNSGC